MQLILWPKKLSRLTIGLITLICLVFLFIIIFSVCRGNVNIQYPPDFRTKHNVCGKNFHGQDEWIIERIIARVKCRMSTQRPPLPKLAVGTYSSSDSTRNTGPLFLSHELNCAAGLGNFMFMTATTICLAQTTKRKSVFKRRHPHMDTFLHKFLLPRMLTANESQQFDLALYRGKTINVEPAGVFDHTLRLKLDPRRAFTSSKLKLAVLRGYLQSWKYFQPCKSLVKYQFVFTRRTYGQAVMALSSKLQPLLKSSDGMKPTSIIGIHVRRGDILQPVHRDFGHTPASKEYFQHALDKMNCTHHPAVFIVVSNDLAWCKKVFANTSNIVFMDQGTPSVDMAILSLTDHLILSVGSFGWWAAYLSDSRDVLYYRNWPRPLSVMAQGYISKDYFMPHWTAMD